MKKTKLTTIVIALLVMALPITAFAAVYITNQAQMTVFSGHIAHQEKSADAAYLSLEVAGENIGQTGNISVYDEAVFPILDEVQGYGSMIGNSTDFEPHWTSESGETPVQSQKFILNANNGSMDDLTYEIEVNGAGANTALRFGVTYGYYSEEHGNIIWCGIEELAMGTPNYGSTGPMVLGDGNIDEGEQIVFCLAVWFDSDTLANMGEYSEDNINITVNFEGHDPNATA